LCGSGIRWHGRPLASAGAALQRVAVGVEAVLREAAQELIRARQVTLDHAQDPEL